MIRSVLIAGGAGFIGSRFVRYALEKEPDCRIVNYDKLTYAGNLENLQGVEERFPGRYRFVRGDICDTVAVESVFADFRPDVVINFAAESHVDRSIVTPNLFIQTNVLGTAVLLHAAQTHWPESEWSERRFLQVSTDEVYGSLPEHQPSAKFTESTPLAPHSPYSASKASADLLVQSYHHTYGFPVLITRCSNNYGPYQFPEKLVPLMINNAVNNKPLPVYGDGLNIRDWLHVDDHCSAIWTVLNRAKPGQLYNIGGNNEIQNIYLVRLLLKVLGKPESLITFVKDRPGHDRRYAIDATKLRTDLGWQPKAKFEDELPRTVEWYLNNQGWVQRIVTGDYQKYYEMMYGNR